MVTLPLFSVLSHNINYWHSRIKTGALLSDGHCVKELIPADQIVHDFCIYRCMLLNMHTYKGTSDKSTLFLNFFISQ